MKCKYVLTFNRTGVLNKDGKSVVQVRIYQPDGAGGNQKLIKTGIHLSPDQWNDKTKKVVNHKNSINLNAQLSQQVADLEKFELQIINADKPFNLKMFDDFLHGKYAHSFTEFLKLELEGMKSTYKTTSFKTYNASVRGIILFREKINFDEIDYSLIQAFDRFLILRKLHQNTIHRYHKHFKFFLTLAVKKGYFDLNKNPYLHFKVKKVDSNRDFLAPDEIEKIEKYQFSEAYNSLNRIRDYFMFMVYTGLRFSDFISLQKSEIKKDFDNSYYLEFKAEKTKDSSNKMVYIPLKFSNKPYEIIEKYKKENSDFIFNDITNQTMNKELKKIAVLCEIKKTITCHVARHTLATFLLYKGVPLSTVQQILGHSSIKTTEIYAKIMNTTVKKDINKVDFSNYN